MAGEVAYPYTKHIVIGTVLGLVSFLIFSQVLLTKGDPFIREMAAQSALVRGDDMLKSRNYSSAVMEFRAYAMLAPDDYRAVSRFSEALILRGEVDESRVQARLALELADDQERVPALTRLARAQLGTDDAVATVDEAWGIALEGERDELELVRAHAYRRVERYAEAADMYRAFLSRNPDSGEAGFGLAKSLEGMQDFQALPALWAAVAERIDAPHSPDYMQIVTRNQSRADRFSAKAESSELTPEEFAAWGLALKDNGHWGQAVGRFRQAVDAGKPSSVTLFWLGVDAEIRGELNEAMELYRGAAADGSLESAEQAVDRLEQ